MADRVLKLQRRMTASTDSVWAVLADFPNLTTSFTDMLAAIDEAARRNRGER